ncbi:MAG TPA: asparagine synthase-related protein, partial [Steroidobacteraceae bacterium]
EAVPRPYRSRVNNALWMELRQAGLPEVLHAEDASSMAFSLETRLPFLDHRLVELCFSLPFDDKISEGWTKLLLRRSTEDLLPPAVRWRRNKFGFPGDYAGWLAGEAGVASIRALLLEPRTLERGMLDRAWLTRRLGGSASSAARWIKQHLGETWTLVTLELWCRLFLDADRALRPAATLARPAESACTLQ